MRIDTRLLAEALPVAAAIGVFGVIYGATSSTVLTEVETIASSALMFSGAAQFTMVGLLDGGATSAAVVVAITVLGLRHLPLAAVVLPRLHATDQRRRAVLALVLTDETTGLAVASPRPVARTIAVAGAAAYLAWLVGTTAGVLGADLLGLAPLAGVMFLLLFIGLSALTCRSRADAARALVAAVLTIAAVAAVPAAGALGAIAVAVAVTATTVVSGS